MVKEDVLDNLISKYYDYQMNDLERIDFEARLALSEEIREYADNQCLTFFKISNSVKFVKKRCKNCAQKISNEFLRKNISVIYLNTVGFKGFYKHLGNGILNILRNNSQEFNRS